MIQEGRYELKYILDEGRLTEALRWLHTYVGVAQKYDGRTVNSLYMDDINYQSARDNLIGIPKRKKLRLRWYYYKDKAKITDVALEAKVRNGRLGYKEIHKLPRLQDTLLSTKMEKIPGMIAEELDNSAGVSEYFNHFLFPALRVSYFREYYESSHGIRITIDSRINFHHCKTYEYLSNSIDASYPKNIMELKFPPKLKNTVSSLLKGLHLIPTRHSKYMVGLAVFGLVIYV